MLRVNEIFGPTIQGEGPFAGEVCSFIRLQGCDFNCKWCDSKPATNIDHELEPMTIEDIVSDINNRMGHNFKRTDGNNGLVVITGGNPLIQNIDTLIRKLEEYGYLIQLETQGSIYKDLSIFENTVAVVSPKITGGSGMESRYDKPRLKDSIIEWTRHYGTYFKFVAGSTEDLDAIYKFCKSYAIEEAWISVITPQNGIMTDSEIILEVGDTYRELIEYHTSEPRDLQAIIFPQLHVWAWGSKSGV